jgi:L-ribulose-5-phosphate 3-epimerase UlaE
LKRAESKAGILTVPGDGCVDFVPVFDRLKQAGYSGWRGVEAGRDAARVNLPEYVMKARRYIREKADVQGEAERTGISGQKNPERNSIQQENREMA